MEGVLCFWSRTPTLTPTLAVPEAATESTGLEGDGARIVLDTVEAEEEPTSRFCLQDQGQCCQGRDPIPPGGRGAWGGGEAPGKQVDKREQGRWCCGWQGLVQSGC